MTVLNPAYWVDRVPRLAAILGQERLVSPIGDPTGRPPDAETMLTLVDPRFLSLQLRELQEVLNLACGISADATGPSGLGSGAIAAGQERLTLTVEEAAAALGISRAFAYESVRRGDIPHIKIGRRLLVPRAALDRMLASAMPDNIEDHGHRHPPKLE